MCTHINIEIVNCNFTSLFRSGVPKVEPVGQIRRSKKFDLAHDVLLRFVNGKYFDPFVTEQTVSSYITTCPPIV